MTNLERIQRKQLIQAAEGYLELAMVYDDRWPLKESLRIEMAQKSIDQLSKITSPQGHKPYILFLKGQSCRTMKDYPRAINYLEQSSRLDLDNIHTMLALAWCYKRDNRIQDAIQATEIALRIERNSPIVNYNLACYWALTGNASKAVVYLSHAFELEPAYRDCVHNESDFDPIRDDEEFLAIATVIV